MLRITQTALVLSVARGLDPTAVLVQQASGSGSDITRLNELTVSSTFTERRIDDVLNPVRVVPVVKIAQDDEGHGDHLVGGSDWPSLSTSSAVKKRPDVWTATTSRGVTDHGARIMPRMLILDKSNTGILSNIDVPDLLSLDYGVAQ